MNFLEASEKSSQFRVLKNFENFRISNNFDQKIENPNFENVRFFRIFLESENFSKTAPIGGFSKLCIEKNCLKWIFGFYAAGSVPKRSSGTDKGNPIRVP